MLVSQMWIEIAVGVALGLGVSLAFILWLAPHGWTDHPDDHRKHHTCPTARTGGMALWVVVMVAQLLGLFPFRLHAVEWMAIHGMALIGLLDDRFDLRPRHKAFVGLAVAMMLAVHVTMTLGRTVTSVPFLGMGVPTHPALIAPLLLFWFWAIPQAYNLIDGINGLSLGVAALLLGVLGWKLGAQSGLFWGALAAVTALNFPKARHFLGDCGALMLGILFAILGVEAFAVKAPDLLLWVFAYPVLDVFLVVAIRHWKGLPLSGADRSHLHHWMMDRTGQRVWVATPLLLCVAALPMLRATAIPGHSPLSMLGLIGLVALALKAFKDRVWEPKKIQRSFTVVSTQVQREIPYLIPRNLKEASGTHPKF
jgi:UDP-GlcNAc:undecaprenyl-phosphate GlcNAc-1-phosphate transferase